MDLLTQHLRERLLANGGSEADHVPLVKFFNPIGAASWLFSELDSDGDTLFGLCDLGFGFPELGCASLSEIASVRLPLGLRIERDVHFAAEPPALGLCRGGAGLRPDHRAPRPFDPCGSSAGTRQRAGAQPFTAVAPNGG